MTSIGRKRLAEIFVAGLSGIRPRIPVHPDALEQRAKARLPREAFDSIAGGAGTEQTLRENREAFQQWGIVPRILRDISQRDPSIKLFGKHYPFPFLLAPIGALELAHPEADRSVARAAAREGIPVIFSSQASYPLETCVAEMGDHPRWFQLYWSQSDELVLSFIQRAEQRGCQALVVTLDTPLPGWRTRDLTHAYFPFLRGMGIAQYVSDPVFQRLMEELPEEGESLKPPRINLHTLQNIWRLFRTYPAPWREKLRTGAPLKAVRTFIRIFSRPSLQWEDLAFLRSHTHLPIVLKGILDPEDARKAVEAGVDGIIVSNHGGRQIDGAVPALQALPSIVQAVEKRIPVLLDSGVRTGADIFKALALGASAVCIGRPYVYGLALGGEQGVREVIQNLKAELDLTMGLAGCRNVEEITPDRLTRLR